jgi:hypothetical protein
MNVIISLKMRIPEILLLFRCIPNIYPSNVPAQFPSADQPRIRFFLQRSRGGSRLNNPVRINEDRKGIRLATVAFVHPCPSTTIDMIRLTIPDYEVGTAVSLG